MKKSKWIQEDFMVCLRCKAVLHFDQMKMGWTCTPLCVKQTFVPAQITQLWKKVDARP